MLTTTTHFASSANTSHVNTSQGPHCPPNNEDKYTIYSAVYSLVFVIGLISNIGALFVFCRIAKRKNASTVYLMNLAIADLLFGLSLPLRVVYYLKGGDWPFGDLLCRISGYFFYVSMYCSIFFLTCLSVSRYLSLVHHIKHQRTFTFRRCVIACISVWLFVLVTTAPFLLNGSQPSDGKIKCFEPVNVISWTRIMQMNYFALVVGFLLPFSVILTCYLLMIRHLVRFDCKSKRVKRDVAMTILVLLVFFICFLPYHVQRTVHLHFRVHHRDNCNLENTLRKSVVATLCLAVANSCFDPLLYIFVGQGFRTFIRTWLKKKEVDPIYTSSSSMVTISLAFIQRSRELEMSSLAPPRSCQTLIRAEAKGEKDEASKTENLINVEQNTDIATSIS
ncbi:cysteinyl leukotriene receptor 1-like [Pristis pectinata]|uniref:cysteinyl leukotriene receptor 1-like n=1 Tax=Pristis pectinata TaxID=685728 RepID=UPI00223E7FED|nr:cysteinyl leukotriene receptor 1-like [Pristis pectinata]XP_051873646.1 cysteinyl leukotriene receptor 1-like [Pristis pectinata]